MSWSPYKLEDVLELKYGKSLPDRKRVFGEFPVYGSGGCVGYHKEAFVKGPGIIVGRKGSIGTVFYEKNDFFPIDTVYYVEHKEELADLTFLYYLLKYLPLSSMNSDAAVPGLNRNNAHRYEVLLPQKPIQQKIASILFAYDDLIENNLRRIELLEKASMELYKEWFVHLRFPGHQHTKIIKGLPDGWEKKKLIDVSNITMGQSPKSVYYNTDGEGLPFHQGVSDFGVRFITHSTYCTVKNRIGEAGDILFSVRAPVGRLNITLDKIVIGRGLSAVRSKIGHQSFLYYQLKTHFYKEDMMGTGAIFAAITKNDLHSLELPLPDHRLIAEFQEHSLSIDEQIKNLFLQNHKLRKGRDLLLPKLMNGNIEV